MVLFDRDSGPRAEVDDCSPGAPIAAIAPAMRGPFGLSPGARFRLSRPRDPSRVAEDCWLFDDETIAVPVAGSASFAADLDPWADLSAWLPAPGDAAGDGDPPLVWIGSPSVIDGARLCESGTEMTVDGQRVPFGFVPPVATNRSYVDASSIAALRGRALRMRGELRGGRWIARTVWPADWRLEASAASGQDTTPAGPGEPPLDAVTAALRPHVSNPSDDAQRARFAAFELWRRPGADPRIAGKPVVALVLNGAQGDDDDAHGGHFAVATGRVGEDGSMADWLVANFYAIDVVSEKAILAALTPLDCYQADLNSGQSWYRPSCVLVAILDREEPAAIVQAAFSRLYRHFYRRRLPYDHATMNCAGISIDCLRALGWRIRRRPGSSWGTAFAAMPLVALAERSLAKGRNAFDYMTEERTRLLPAVAFEEAGASVLRLARGDAQAGGQAQALGRAVASVWFVALPQLPSSRAFGTWPIAGIDEHRARVPRDPAARRTIPLPRRGLPRWLQRSPWRPRRRSNVAVVAWVVVVAAAVVATAWRWLAAP